MSKIKILGIAPYVGLGDLLEECCKARRDVDIKTVVGDLDNGVAAFSTLSDKNFNIIISRGGTATLLREVTQIPVVDIKISVFDMLCAITLAKGYGGSFAVVGFKEISHPASIINDLLKYGLIIKTINRETELDSILRSLKTSGISLIVGDNVTTAYAKRFGFNTLLATSSKESVVSALDECVTICNILKGEIKKRKLSSITYKKVEDGGTVELSTFKSGNENYKMAVEKAGESALSPLPTVIFGERGVGKDALAHYIYSRSPNTKFPLIFIECKTLSNKDMDFLTQNENSPLLSVGETIYFKDAHTLSDRNLRILQTFISSTFFHKRCKLLFSYCNQYGVDYEGNPLLYFLSYKASATQITIPPLRDRGEDLSSLCAIYIGELNRELGTSVIGVEESGLEILKGFDWYYNSDQFKKVLKGLVLGAKGRYITESEVRYALIGEKSYEKKGVDKNVSLDGTLDEIESRIILKILDLEGGNQSKAAKRLGISRSTLWRKIKL